MKDRSHVDSPFSGKIVGILLAVALFPLGQSWCSQAGHLVRDRNVAGAHPFSTSALGYNGFVQLLQEQGYPAEVSRLERTLEDSDWGLLVLTLPNGVQQRRSRLRATADYFARPAEMDRHD